jgi:hypothetical protein
MESDGDHFFTHLLTKDDQSRNHGQTYATSDDGDDK